MSYIMVDVESDGPVPGDYSMICFGAIVVEPSLSKTFYRMLKPLPGAKCIESAFAISGLTHDEVAQSNDPKQVMLDFKKWISEINRDRIHFISDNNGYDYMFISWYFNHFLETNPFGHTSRNLNDLYKGMRRDMFSNFKHLRKTKHTHNPVDDARGNAEAFLEMAKTLNIKF